jgi:transcriptional regulator with XRE-family HTH domain
MENFTTPAERLKMLREKRYQTVSAAAEALGKANSTYTQHENGLREISRKAAIEYARFFGTTVDFLLRGKTARKTTQTFSLPLLGKVGAGAVVDLLADEVPGAPLDDIEISFDDDFVVQVTGDSMWPRFMPGEYIVVEGQPVSPMSLIGRYAVVQVEEDGRRLIKRILRGDKPGTVNLWSHKADEMKNIKVLGAWRIKCVLYE